MEQKLLKLSYWRILANKWLIPVVLLIIVNSACQRNNTAAKGIFYYNESAGISSLDPAFAKAQATMWIAHQLFNTLVETNDSLKTSPSLAKSWHISEDRTVYTFVLRSDVFFHDNACFPQGKGRKLIAQDVVYSFSRILDPLVASPGAWIFNEKIARQSAFIAVNDSVFQLTLKEPYTPILGVLSMQYCSVIPEEAVNYYQQQFRRNPVGTGPFELIAWEEGQALVLKKNPHYFELDEEGKRLPYLNGIKVSFYDSKATEFLLFRQQQLDFINDIDPSFKDEVLTKRGTLRKGWEDKVVLKTGPYLNVEYLGILTDEKNSRLQNSPLKDRRIRQAINYGFDREKMIVYMRNSLGMPALSGFVPKGLPSFSEEKVPGYFYNPEKSKQLLKAAGYENGIGLPVIKLQTIAIYSDMADFIARQLRDIGISVQVETMQRALLMDLAANGQTLFFRGSWIADYPDAENYLSVFYSKNPAPPNYTRYRNPVFDELFEKALKEENDSLRYILYQQADKIIMEDAPVVPLWYDQVIQLIQPYVKDYKTNALNLLELRRVKKQDAN